MVIAVIMNHLATPKSTHCTVLTCNINNDNGYLQSINMFSYRITHSIFSTGGATISNKSLKTKICSESLKFLLLKVNLEGFVSKYNARSVFILELLTVAPWLSSLVQRKRKTRCSKRSIQQASVTGACSSKSRFGLHSAASQQYVTGVVQQLQEKCVSS